MPFGQNQYAQGFISDQTQLLQEIRDGLSIYNESVEAVVARFSELTTRQTSRVSQAPKPFSRKAPGAKTYSQRSTYRLLNAPLDSYELNSEFDVEWLQDALESDVRTELNAAMAGDAELQQSLFWQAVLTKRTVGAVETAYQAGFYNGELDVPPFRNNSFASAHYHYLGINTTTLAKSHLQAAKADVIEHGYGLQPNSLHIYFNSAQCDDVQQLLDTNAATTILQAMTAMRERAIDKGVLNTGVTIEGMELHFDDHIPAGYFAVLAEDVRPVIRREHVRPEYQGLQIYTETPNENYPLLGQRFLRRIGFAVQHMGAGTCRQIVASTTYDNPTFRIPAE